MIVRKFGKTSYDCEKIRKDFIFIQKNQLIYCIWENKCFSIILGYVFYDLLIICLDSTEGWEVDANQWWSRPGHEG